MAPAKSAGVNLLENAINLILATLLRIHVDPAAQKWVPKCFASKIVLKILLLHRTLALLDLMVQ